MKPNKPMNEFPLLSEGDENIVLARPHIPANALKYLEQVLSSRWIGQGPKVDEFEKSFSQVFCSDRTTISTGSGTDALHLSYLLAGIGPGDEVIAPVFTCTATNIPLLYLGAKIIFADIDPSTLNVSLSHLESLITENTKAIVVVHYGGLPCNMSKINALAKKFNIKVIEDAAHALGATHQNALIGSHSDFVMFSFQAIKHLTTGDGGMISIKDSSLENKAKRLRWFGIDRSQKQLGIWENDIKEIGYKYQMNDLSAALGLASLEEFNETLKKRITLRNKYIALLSSNENVKIIGKEVPIGDTHAAWLFTILVDDRENLQKKLRLHKIESAQMHYRNDRYSIFGCKQANLPGMDYVEEKYLVLPLHTAMSIEDVEKICHIINSGW